MIADSPLTPEQQRQILQRVRSLLARTGGAFQRDLPVPEVRFTLAGQRAGIYAWRRTGETFIDFNPWVFAADFEHHLQDTVAHEVAHHAARVLHGPRIRPHGIEWKRLARLLGATPRASGNFSLQGVPVRRQQRHRYRCDCRDWQLTTTRHNRIQQKRQTYSCRFCATPLRLIPDAPKSN